jgi:hypothetical protein
MTDNVPSHRTGEYTRNDYLGLLLFVLAPLAMIFLGVLETVLLLAVVWVVVSNEPAR